MIDIDTKTNPLIQYYENLGFKSEIFENKKIFKVFSSAAEELNSLYNGVGLRNISNLGILELSGKDVLDYLHRISTNSLKNISKESVEQTIFTSEKGKIIDIATIMNFEDHQLLICSEAHKNRVKSWIEKYIIMDDVKVNDPNGNYALLEVLGPQSDSFMTLVCGNVINEIELNKFKSVRSEGIMFFLSKLRSSNGHFKFWLLTDPENAVKLVDYMINNKGIFDFNLIGEDAFNSFRISQGIPVAPNELNDQYNPHEANAISLVNFTKGCYIGQEVIARLETYDKVQKYLKGISFNEPINEAGEYNLFDAEENEAGKVTSIAYSHKCGKYIGLAYLRKAYLQEGTFLIAKNGNGKDIPVTVKNIPFRK